MNLRHLLTNANNEIKMAMYKISRCVDSGDHHIELEPGRAIELHVNERVPTSCKVSLIGT